MMDTSSVGLPTDLDVFAYDHRDAIVVLAAKEEELAPFLELISVRRGPVLPGIVLWTVEVAGKPVVLARCASGKINATLATFWLVFGINASYIIVVGTCGAVDPHLETGDILLSWQVLIHDYGILSPDGFRYRGSVALLLDGREERFEIFQGDQTGCEKAMRFLANKGLCVRQGLLASGDVFLSHSDSKQRLYRKHGVTAVEMTVGGVAATCRARGTPWLAIRCASDQANMLAESNYEKYWPTAARRSAEAALVLLQAGWWPTNGDR